MADETIKLIRSILNPKPAGMLIKEINEEYKELTGESVPFARFHFSSLVEFLRASNQFYGVKTPNGFKLTAKVTEASKHVHDLARTQVVSKQERKRRMKMSTGTTGTLKRSQSKTRIMANVPPTPKKYGTAAKQQINRRRNSVSRDSRAAPSQQNNVQSQQNNVPPPLVPNSNIAPPKLYFSQPLGGAPINCAPNELKVAERAQANIPPPLALQDRLKKFANSSSVNADLAAINKPPQEATTKAHTASKLSPNERECVVARKPSMSPSYTPQCTPIKVFPAKSGGSRPGTPGSSGSQSGKRVDLHSRFVPKQLPFVEDPEVEEKAPMILTGRAMLNRFKRIAELKKAAENAQNNEQPPQQQIASEPPVNSDFDKINQKVRFCSIYFNCVHALPLQIEN